MQVRTDDAYDVRYACTTANRTVLCSSFLVRNRKKDEQETFACRVIVMRKDPIIASSTEDNEPTLKRPYPL